MGVVKVHYHKDIETIAYLLSGECIVFLRRCFGARVTAHAGDQVFVPPDVPHAPCNKSGAPCTSIVVNASGSDQDGIVLQPELDELPPGLGPALGATPNCDSRTVAR